MDRRDGGAIQRAIQLAPLARRRHGASGKTQEVEHGANLHRIGGKHFAEQRYGGLIGSRRARRLNGTLLGFTTRITQHRAGEDILRLGVRRHTEARHVDPDDANAVDLLRQKFQRHARGGRHAEVDDDDGVVFIGLGEREDRLTDVLEEFAGDQSLGAEGDIADRALRAIEMRGEGQSIDAAGRAREHHRRAPHAQADAQATQRLDTCSAVDRAAQRDNPARGLRASRSCRRPWRPRA